MNRFIGGARGRVIGAALVLLLLAAAYSAWLIWRTERDLRAAESSANRLEQAVRDDEPGARQQALSDLRRTTQDAKSRTDGLWWSVMTRLPAVGDDLRGVEALSASLDLLARGAVEPLLDTADNLEDLSADDGIDLDRLRGMTPAVASARDALSQAREIVDSQSSSGFAGAIKPRYEEYVRRISDLEDMMRSADRALRVMPELLGSEGPRDYLFVFQNNAEIRSTGGIAGSWARIHADRGTLVLREQGGAAELNIGQPVAELTEEEAAVYDELPALFFQDPNFIPDFPRVAELYNAFWAKRYPNVRLDGVFSMDPVGMSYLMKGTGPIEADGITLTADSIVEDLLSDTYLEFEEPVRQDKRFQEVARSIFEAATGNIPSPVDFVTGFARAANERRFLLAPFDESVIRDLDGSSALGQLSGDEGATPHVDIGLNDATGSKMSYFLRYGATVASRSCQDGIQKLEGELNLNQTIKPREARLLPEYVTGGGAYGTEPGEQFVTVRIYGPYSGSISDVRLNGDPLNPDYGLSLQGRPVVTVGVLISNIEDYYLTWEMETARGARSQDGDGRLQLTPGVVSGVTSQRFPSSC